MGSGGSKSTKVEPFNPDKKDNSKGGNEKNENSKLIEEKQEDYGETVKYDPSFKGPIANRSCTDVICCLLFLVCFLGMLAVSIWAYMYGNPYRLLYPSDSDGNLCGDGDYAGKPYVFFFDLVDCAKVGAAAVISTGCPTPQICVSECPTSNWAVLQESSYYTQFTSPVVNLPQSTLDKLYCKYSTAAAIDGGYASDVCVESCPTIRWSWMEQQYLEARDPSKIQTRERMVCKQGVDPINSGKTLPTLITNEECAAYYLESEPLVGRCIPSFITSLAGTVFSSNFTDKYGNVVNSTALAQTGGLGLGAVLAFIWILLMRWIAGVIIWVTLFLFLVVFTFCTYYSFDKYMTLKDNSTTTSFSDIQLTTSLDYYSNLYYTWLAAGIISAVLLFIVLVIVIFLRKRILIAVELIKESSRAVGAMIFTLFWPIIPFLLQVALFAYWGVTAIYLASVGDAQYGDANKTAANVTVTINGSLTTQIDTVITSLVNTIPCNPNDNTTVGEVCSFIKFGGNTYTIYLQFFQLFMLFWCMNFIVALGQMTLAGAFASYYWAFNKPSDIPAFPLAASLWRCFRYHLGSIAFGSLIIAIIQIIRVILEYIDHKLKNKENIVTKFILGCLKCCFWCLEKFMKFLNKNAYILVAVYGKNFCVSAKNAFLLIMRNILRVAVVDKVTDFLLFVGKLVVAGLICALAFVFFSGDLENAIPISSITSYVNGYVPTLNYYLIPVIIITIGTYVIASAFFSVYSMAVDTLFLCFLEDLERHDGSEEKPYYMSKGLMSILDKKNKVDEHKKD